MPKKFQHVSNFRRFFHPFQLFSQDRLISSEITSLSLPSIEWISNADGRKVYTYPHSTRASQKTAETTKNCSQWYRQLKVRYEAQYEASLKKFVCGRVWRWCKAEIFKLIYILRCLRVLQLTFSRFPSPARHLTSFKVTWRNFISNIKWRNTHSNPCCGGKGDKHYLFSRHSQQQRQKEKKRR